MGRVWKQSASKYSARSLMTICQVKVLRGHEVKNSQMKYRVWRCDRHVFLGQFFVDSAKSDERALFVASKPGKV